MVAMRQTTNMQEVEGIDEYIAAFPESVQTQLQKMRQTIKKSAPKAKETISYGIPTFKLDGYLVHFGAFKNHIGFYPGAAAIAEFKDKLTGYKSAKGSSVQFSFDGPLPSELIAQIVRFKVKRNQHKKSQKMKSKRFP